MIFFCTIKTFKKRVLECRTCWVPSFIRVVAAGQQKKTPTKNTYLLAHYSMYTSMHIYIVSVLLNYRRFEIRNKKRDIHIYNTNVDY